MDNIIKQLFDFQRFQGNDRMEYLEEEDFAGIMDFNSLAALSVLGNAASSLTESVLMGSGGR